MTSKARVFDEWERDGVGIAVIRDHGGGRRELLQWEPVVVTGVDDATFRPEQDSDRLRLREDDARAIYEALAEHFGHAGHDIRNLRKDYDDERRRVDLFINNAIKAR